jgi:arylsulfatase A-like enzyme
MGSDPQRPNILFVLFDCMRSRMLFDPSRRVDAPTIRRLIDGGAALDTCIATATTTSPSMGTLFTGTLPPVHGIRSLRGYKLNPDVATLAEVLRDRGYHTHAEATGPVVKQKGMHRGFDAFHHRDEDLYDPRYWSTLQERLAAMPADRPWFFYLHLWELHWPRSVPRAFDRGRYGAHRYERALSALDALKLPRLLELAGGNTVLAFTGDHGEVPRLDRAKKVARRLRWKAPKAWIDVRSGHGFGVIEDLVKVPVVLHGPGVPAAGRVGTAVRHVDLFPTLLDLAGAAGDPRAAQGPGSSLLPLLPSGGEDRPGYSEAVGVKMGSAENWLVALRHDGWKLVKRAAGDRSPLLWRLPDERTDVAAANPEVVASLEAELDRLTAGEALDRTGEDLTPQESAEVEEHLRDLGYID